MLTKQKFQNFFEKDPTMMKRLNDIAKFPEQDKTHILYTIDAMISNVKLKAI